jgi:hypothetical protein
MGLTLDQRGDVGRRTCEALAWLVDNDLIASTPGCRVRRYFASRATVTAKNLTPTQQRRGWDG